MTDISSEQNIALVGHRASLGNADSTAHLGPATRSVSPPLRAQSGLPLSWGIEAPQTPAMTPGRRWALSVKRASDVIMAAFGLLALLPLMLAVALAIKLTSPGPVLLRQERTGLGGRPFTILKFRSMYFDAADKAGIVQAQPEDKRVTPVGRFLRQTSVDELPQLINILCGDMSVVGPRPHVPNMLAAGIPYEDLVPYYEQRVQMRPGLTGWAQANGLRGPTVNAQVARARLNHDIAYIQNFSLWLDLVIIVMTLKREFVTGSGF